MTTSEIRTQDLWEMESAQMWEEQFAPTQPIEKMSNEDRIDAYAPLTVAMSSIERVLDNIGESWKIVEDTPQGDHLSSIYDRMSDFYFELKEVSREIWRYGDNG